jgi:leader peptidase (prepilin peptidase) / N-methyltransferase
VIVSDLPVWIIRALAFVFGALWGSFFNVAIYRWPRDMSVVEPKSHCPACKAPIPAGRNVPIFGYLFLRGRAACCGAKLSPRYFVVELLSAFLCLALAERYIVSIEESAPLLDAVITTGLFFAFVGGLVIATFVDLEWMEIPDEVSIGGTALGLATITLRQPGPDAVDAALGAGAGFLFVQLLLVWAWHRMTGNRGMGEGDSKLLMFAGAFLGWKGALFALVAGALQALIASGIAALAGVKRRAPGEEENTEAKDADAEAKDADAKDTWTSPAPLEISDGTKVELKEQGQRLEVRDRRGRLIWEYVDDPEERKRLRRAIPFGPFIALGAIEFLFFGDAIIEAYLGLME